MWFRQTGAEFTANRGEANRQAMCSIVEAGEIPGLLAYVDGVPAGWVSVGPREAYPRLERSRAAKRVDSEPVWSVVCFYTAARYRGRGLMRRLIEAAADYAREQGAAVIEAYPKDAALLKPTTGAAYVGISGAFTAAGFVEVARHQPARPLVRRTLKPE
ncbi:MAG: GNAT family N-acetyltransferase [Anaerolinea sp.]|nr:GNAT family N-acetyltransferase [Anaerolinea sp.]